MKFNPIIDTPNVDEVAKEVIPEPKTPVIFSLTSTTSVNVRRDPVKDSPSLGILYIGTKVDVEEFDKDWYKIVRGDHKGGYVRRPYLK